MLAVKFSHKTSRSNFRPTAVFPTKKQFDIGEGSLWGKGLSGFGLRAILALGFPPVMSYIYLSV